MGFLLQLEAITSSPHVKRKPLIAVNILKEWITDQLHTQAIQTLKTNGAENTRGGGGGEREPFTHHFCIQMQTLTYTLLTPWTFKHKKGRSASAASNHTKTHTHAVGSLKASLWFPASTHACDSTTAASALFLSLCSSSRSVYSPVNTDFDFLLILFGCHFHLGPLRI